MLRREGRERNVSKLANEVMGLGLERAGKITTRLEGWMVDLESGKPIAVVGDEIKALLAGLEDEFPGEDIWYDMRLVLAEDLVYRGGMSEAVELITGIQDARQLVEGHSAISDRLVANGAEAHAVLLNDLILHTLEHDPERFLSYFREVRNYAIRRVPRAEGPHGVTAVEDTIDQIGGPVDRIADWAAVEMPHLPLADWPAILEVVQDDGAWQEGVTLSARRHIGYVVAVWQTETRQAQPVAKAQKTDPLRTQVEKLKIVIGEVEKETPEIAAWDRLRYVATVGLYADGHANAGRGMARSMRHPEMMAAVCHHLLAQQDDKEAVALLDEIPAPRVAAKLMYAAGWKDKAAMRARLEDITVATVKNQQKYDPEYRIECAKGFLELCQENAAASRADGNEQAAAAWDEKAVSAAKRVGLLTRQMAAGFISSPSKKSGKKKR